MDRRVRVFRPALKKPTLVSDCDTSMWHLEHMGEPADAEPDGGHER